MKLKEFLENLNELVKENPQALEYLVVSASDDEGNSYSEVVYDPNVGYFDSKEDDFTNEEAFEDWEIEEEVNAICIN